ncbi:MAG: NAD(P)H-dependent oxidoreductase [Coriobacteriales bacterium]|jgi:putative NADPH-quinone reductase|nr:NAD(P)H-dependent oxidoreductase [Coriobacteriales bacterium]
MAKRKILVVCGHPYGESFDHACYEAYLEGLEKAQVEVESLDLGALKFDPVLRMGYSHRMPQDDEIDRSQELIKWANQLVIFYPIWFSNMPSLLKGWLERTITPKFAYNMKGLGTVKHLAGRSAEVFVSCDSPTIIYKLFRLPQWEIGNRLLSMAGIRIHGFHIFGSCHAKSDQQRRDYLDQLGRRAATLS